MEWKFLIDSIAVNGYLHVPLGQWTMIPDQILNFMLNQTMDILYKRYQDKWRFFGNKRATSRRFVALYLIVDTIPGNSSPVRVIKASSYLILLAEDNQQAREQQETLWTRKWTMIETQVLGKYTINDHLIDKLRIQWHTK